MEGVGDFQNAVQRDLAWRKVEISALRTLANQSDNTADHVFRSAQVLLCAHWEGFLKTSAKLYVDHVFSQDIELRELIPSLVAVAYFGEVMRAAEAKYPGSEEHHVKLATKILATVNSRVDRPSWKVDTEGNPGSETVDRILKTIGIDAQLGLDDAAWTTTKVFINEHLVRDRHQVAHGQGTKIDRGSVLARAQRLLELLDTLSNMLLDAAQRQSYRITSPA